MSNTVVKMPENRAGGGGRVHQLIQAFRHWNARRAAKAELRALPNHLLNDIGIRRELIDEYVDGAIARRANRPASVVGLDRSSREARTERHAKAA